MTPAPRRAQCRPAALAGVLAGVLALAACTTDPAPATAPTTPVAAPASWKPALADPRSWAPHPTTAGGLSTVAAAQGDRLLLHTGHGDVDFWSGVNLGSTTPGHSPGELAISREEYRRWFAQMGQMGVHTLRVYTIHPPAMYEELKAYDEAHRDAPIYLVQGVYLPDESYLRSHDLFAAGPTAAMDAELRDASAAVHGDLTRAPRTGRAGGTWTADVSPWVAAWIVGVEWDGYATRASDARNAAKPLHRGRYFANTTDATPTERWLAARMDELATREAARGVSAPIAFVNWPTTDPLRHPAEPLRSEDAVGVDADHVLPTKAWPGGTFASFHAYPYYPDFLRHQPAYAKADDPYLAYLLDLKRHFAPHMPLLVTEFGVPSSLGSAHDGTNGRDQGDHSEQEALAMDASMLRSFKDAGLAGGLLFSWVDEWFKFTWNTIGRQAVVDGERRAVWHDPLTNEQHFGLVAQDPSRVGRSVPWESRSGVQRVTVDHDASWAYLTIDLDKAPTAPVRLGFDVVPGGLALPGGSTRAGGAYDYAVTVDPAARTATMVVDGAIDPVLLDGLPAASVPRPAADGWSLERLTVNRPFVLPLTGQHSPAEFLEVGRLRRGSWDPAAADFDDRSTWQLQGARVTLRLPWSMLGLGDPSSRTAVVPRDRRPVAVPVQDIGVVVDAGPGGRADLRLRWDTWNRATHTERVKAGAQVFVDALADVSR
ncbi:hypothetical protein RKE38_09445 [Phycicoccus sp. M110.8]|uniref:hypothetical protein n=1 Tax=Phycicoccus sp. M110.8 TaxID=3075433 RepID=UPI0028FD8C5C|nr:hypothetical protein [Phycicoccus sp. M110.8]MDU0313909.1 hypothetical protein [Phycicoccus sp. M110.8]